MRLEDELAWIEDRALTAEAAWARALAAGGPPGPAPPPDARIAALAARLRAAGGGVLWRGTSAYPVSVERRLGRHAPAWLLFAGDRARLGRPACAVIGSRATPAPLLDAARQLGRALAAAGIVVVSGAAPGADRAAHAGALDAGRRGAGTIAVPACGLFRAAPLLHAAGEAPPGYPCATWLGMGRLEEPFSAGLAVRRNALMAALSGGVVLVASGLRGGSAYAVRWAIDRRLPLWCFESGDATPPANRHLLHSELARPLPLDEPPARWVDRIGSGLAAPDQAELAPPDAGQLDWLALPLRRTRR